MSQVNGSITFYISHMWDMFDFEIKKGRDIEFEQITLDWVY